MKLFIASDIHGSAYWCRKLIDAYKKHGDGCNILLLGDILYHGPRNPLPEGYAPQEVATALNELSNRIICVRGNCDADVDQMVLNFPLLNEQAVIYDGDSFIFATHGDKYTPEDLPPLRDGALFLSGHTHIPANDLNGSVRTVNPGSVSLPKNDTPHSYIIYTDGELRYFDLLTEQEYSIV